MFTCQFELAPHRSTCHYVSLLAFGRQIVKQLASSFLRDEKITTDAHVELASSFSFNSKMVESDEKTAN